MSKPRQKKVKNFAVSFTTKIKVQAIDEKDAEEKVKFEVEQALGYNALRNLMDVEVDEVDW